MVSASEINLNRSKLIQLARHLEVDDKEKQYHFSLIALLEMYDTYQQELERTLTYLPETIEKRAEVIHWRFATQSYLETLNEYLYLMDSGTSISFFISKQNKIFLLIGDVPVIISGPNSGADRQIETNIVAQFCFKYDCEDYFKKADDSFKTPLSNHHQIGVSKELLADEISAEWSLESNYQASFILSNGLIYNFSDIKDRKDKERWAIEISNELILLSDYLKRTQQKGKVINWSSVMIEALPVTDNAYKIILNKNNDYIKLSLPLLGKNPALLNAFIPWLKSAFEKQSGYRMIINNAEQYLIKQ